MKKLLAIVLALVFCFSLAACGSDQTPVEEYVEENREALEKELASAVSATGMDMEMEIEADGYGVIIKVETSMFDEFDDEAREEYQDTMEKQVEAGALDAVLEGVQKDVPETEYVEYKFYDSNGDIVVEFVIGEK